MSANGIPVTSLPGCANLAPTDLVVVVYNANNANTIPSVRTIEYQNMTANLIISNNVPANSTANGTAGNIAFATNGMFYLCISNNVWVQTTLTTF